MHTACPTDPVSVPHHYLDRLSQLAKSCIADLSALVDHLDQVRKEIAGAGLHLLPDEASTATPATYEFHLDGQIWRVAYGEEHGLIEDIAGMRIIAALLSEPHVGFGALELERMTQPAKSNCRSVVALADEDREVPMSQVRPQIASDQQAMVEYKTRLEKLEKEIEDARELGSEAREESLTRERNAILKEVRKMTGRHRRRLDTPEAEKARQRVQKKVNRAYRALQDGRMFELVKFLRRSISTGLSCVYNPGASAPVWKI